MTTISKTILIVVIASVVFFVGGFTSGAIYTSIRYGETSHINAIRDGLDTLKLLNKHPDTFESVASAIVRTELLTNLCYRYDSLNNQNKSKIRNYLAQYNDITYARNTSLVLPAFNDKEGYRSKRNEYCSLKP